MPVTRPLLAATGALLLAVGLVPAAAVAASAAPTAAVAASVSVVPSTDLDRDGQTVEVSLADVPDGKGVYLQWCPDNPAGTRWPSGTCASSPQVWASSNPAAIAQGATALGAQPFRLALTPTITTAAGTTDCRTTTCAVFLRLDHFSPGDTSLDRFVPVSFAAAPTPTPTPTPTTTSTPEVPAYAVSAAPTTGLDRDGDTVAVTIAGLADDQGVYVRLCALGSGGRPAADACDGQGRWVRETYPYGPYPTDGSVVRPSAGPVELDVRARFGSVDCTVVACGVHVRRDHLAPSDTTLDRAIPLTFAAASSSPSPTTSGSPSPTGSPTPSGTATPSPSATDARVTLERATVAVGGSLGLEASGFDADERVLVELHSDPVELAVVTADGEGAVSTTVVLPGTVPVGEHMVVLTGQSSGRTAEAALVVVAATPDSTPPTNDADDAGTDDSDSDLASTGGSPLRPAALAAVLLAAGTALLVVATRRPRRH
ncbi:MAG: hypothetical protein U0S36_06525 [Candidatus Nanopelagicales bacterium]